jgi:outer membrane autotransporter protein
MAESRIGTDLKYATGRIVFRTYAHWLHELGEAPRGIDTAKKNGLEWQVRSVSAKRDGVEYGVSVISHLAERLSLRIGYDGTSHGAGFNFYRIGGGVALRF